MAEGRRKDNRKGKGNKTWHTQKQEVRKGRESKGGRA